jgi:hypothetical protein
MKTTVLLSALFLFTTGSFAQTNVKNNSAVTDHASIKSNEDGSKFQNATQASSTTSINSHAVKKAEKKAQAKIKKEKKTIASTKSTLGAEASAKGQETKKEALEHRPDWATAHANVKAGGTDEAGKVNGNVSVNNSVAASARLKKNKASEIKANNKATIKAGKKIKSNVHSRAALHAHAAPVKINTQLKTDGGINIR